MLKKEPNLKPINYIDSLTIKRIHPVVVELCECVRVLHRSHVYEQEKNKRRINTILYKIRLNA